MRISDWSSDVCSSDLSTVQTRPKAQPSGINPGFCIDLNQEFWADDPEIVPDSEPRNRIRGIVTIVHRTNDDLIWAADASPDILNSPLHRLIQFRFQFSGNRQR